MIRPARRAAVGLALLLALTACSGDSPQAAPAPAASSPTPVPTSTPSPEPSITVPSTPTASAAPSATPTAEPSETAPEDPLAPGPPLETAPPPGQPTCRAAALTVVDANDPIVTRDATQELFLVRTSGPDCQLRGYPTVQLRDGGGAVLPVSYRPGGFGLPAERPATVTLSRSTSVSFVLATGRTGTCTTAASARVTLPGSGAAITASTAFSPCAGSVGLTPVRRQGAIE